MKKRFSANVLSFLPVKKIVYWKGFPIILQLLVLAGLLVVPLFGLGIGLG
ncbi:hypothetical protein ACFL2Q_13315 [Thermodesulfobacteriota bacterium]